MPTGKVSGLSPSGFQTALDQACRWEGAWTSGSSVSGVYGPGSQVWLTSSTWWEFEYLQNDSRIWLRISSIALGEELKVPDFVFWLHC